MDKFRNKCEEDSPILPSEETSRNTMPKDSYAELVKPTLKDIKAACRRGKGKKGRRHYSRLSSRNKPMPSQHKGSKRITGKHSLSELILHGSMISVARLTSKVEDFVRAPRAVPPGPRSPPELSPSCSCEGSSSSPDLEKNVRSQKQPHTRTFDIETELRKIQLVREELDKIVIGNRAH